MTKLRLHKFMAQCGVASRRKAEELIKSGVVEVNDAIVTAMGVSIDPAGDVVTVKGKKLKAPEQYVYFLFNKPRAVMTTLRDPGGRKTVRDFFQQVPYRVFPVGRLDYHSEGLLLVTNDGEWAHELQHPSKGWEKVYHARVKGCPTAGELAKLRKGVYLADGRARAVHARIISSLKDTSWVEIVVIEGRKHLVRRMCAAIGYPVKRLRRVQVGPYKLGNIPVGRFVPTKKKYV